MVLNDAQISVSSRDSTYSLVSGWLIGFSSKCTRLAYRNGIKSYLEWCALSRVEPSTAKRVHVDAWARSLEASGYSPGTVATRLTAVSSWYSWLVNEEVIPTNPVRAVKRPYIDPDASSTIGLTAAQAKALVAAVDAQRGQTALRGKALIRLLLGVADR